MEEREGNKMSGLADGNPIWWFRPIETINVLLAEEPDAVEYLKIETGETFIHTFGTAFWRGEKERFNLLDLMTCKITHWRIKPKGYSECNRELHAYKKGGEIKLQLNT
jgi:hypothetical protein